MSGSLVPNNITTLNYVLYTWFLKIRLQCGFIDTVQCRGNGRERRKVAGVAASPELVSSHLLFIGCILFSERGGHVLFFFQYLQVDQHDRDRRCQDDE